jgi:hypothetical protein
MEDKLQQIIDILQKQTDIMAAMRMDSCARLQEVHEIELRQLRLQDLYEEKVKLDIAALKRQGDLDERAIRLSRNWALTGPGVTTLGNASTE